MGRDPQHFNVFALDIKDYSVRNDAGQVELRQQLRDLQQVAARETSIELVDWHLQDTGDGVVALIPATVPKVRLVADLVRELLIALLWRNQPRKDEDKIRLRVAFHHGDVYREETGFPGATVVDTCRLLDSDPLRKALELEPKAQVALILSDVMFKDVEGQRDVDRRDFCEVQVVNKQFTGTAWIRLPGFSPPDLSTGTLSAASPPDSSPANPEEPEERAKRSLDPKGSTVYGQMVVGDSNQIAGRDVRND